LSPLGVGFAFVADVSLRKSSPGNEADLRLDLANIDQTNIDYYWRCGSRKTATRIRKTRPGSGR